VVRTGWKAQKARASFEFDQVDPGGPTRGPDSDPTRRASRSRTRSPLMRHQPGRVHSEPSDNLRACVCARR
jgi:hypothetical protein